MKLNEAIRELLKMCNISQNGLGEKIGMKSGAFATVMKRNNMQVKTLLAITNALGYEIVLRPKSGTNRSERTVVVDMVGEES